MIGQTLAHYKVTEKLGEGGMGEVYRAEDTKLGREVAIKVLPEAVANDPERLGRFEREAKVLASLNHTNIAAIYGLEEIDGRRLLVMELAEGETLKDAIERGPIFQADALPVALQIAEALEAAHDQGIVHRDLKPANVVVDADGNTKVLDFGLAKALEGDPTANVASALSMSPTLTQQMTEAGMILGTAAYMSPEQARGKPVDRKADIWAFGCVLFEMLSGSSAYGGETVTDILGAIVHKDPDWEELPESVAPPIRELLERCLDKDPRHRLQAIGEARLVLERYITDPKAFEAKPETATETAVEVQKGTSWLPWAVAGLLAVALVASFWLLRPEKEILRATIPPPIGTNFHLSPFNPGPAVLSPDGKRLAFTAQDGEGTLLLYVRDLEDNQARALSGTEDCQYPFWSPDSRWIGFFSGADSTLKKIDSTGGPPLTLADAVDGKGGSWGSQDMIVFAPSFNTPIHKVPAAGGESTAITEIDGERHDSHRQPSFLPDGDLFLFVARGAAGGDGHLMMGSIEGDTPPVEVMTSATRARFAHNRLLFVRENTLMAQPFDPKAGRLLSEAVPLAEDVVSHTASAMAVFSSSDTGILTYQTGQITQGVELEWRDREGRVVGTLGDTSMYRVAKVSPDGNSAVVTILDPEANGFDLWIYEIDRNIRTRFTFDAGSENWPIWSADSQSIFYRGSVVDDSESVSDQDPPSERHGIYRKAVSGVGEAELLFQSDSPVAPTAVTPDGTHLVFGKQVEGFNWDIWVLPLDGEAEPFVFRATEFLDFSGTFSPDGRWLSYISNESGEFHSYATPFPGPGRKWQISSEPGSYPTWTRDGRSIIYPASTGQMISVEIETSENDLRIGESTELFLTVAPSAGGAHYSIGPDAERFLTVPLETTQSNTLLNLIVNWPTDLEQR